MQGQAFTGESGLLKPLIANFIQGAQEAALLVVLFIDRAHIKVTRNGGLATIALYSIYGITAHGQRELVALYPEQGAKSATEWGRCLQDLKNRGLEDVLNGEPESGNPTSPQNEGRLGVRSSFVDPTLSYLWNEAAEAGIRMSIIGQMSDVSSWMHLAIDFLILWTNDTVIWTLPKVPKSQSPIVPKSHRPSSPTNTPQFSNQDEYPIHCSPSPIQVRPLGGVIP